jgi:acetyl-CoA carboxylase carboxyltransferase component
MKRVPSLALNYFIHNNQIWHFLLINPGMSDYVIMVKNKAKVFLGGPPLVKMATGEIVDDESLGGAEMHSRVSGVSDFLAANEFDAIVKARNIISSIHWRKTTPLPRRHLYLPVEEPLYDPDEILGIVSANPRIPFDCREVIARVVDGSRFFEFKPSYGTSLTTCFARIHGIPIGIIANYTGVIFSDSANKGTQFIDLCNQRHIPLLFMHNVTGFMVGRKYEEGGIIKHGSKFINAVSNSGVPHLTIIMGASYGAGNYGMCGRAYQPRFLFSWPNSKCSVMGPEQLTGVMDIVMREAARKSGVQIDEEMAKARKEMFRQAVEEQSSAYYTTSRVIDDGIIDPRDTRNVLGLCLSVIYGAPVQGANHCGVSRM